MRTPLKVKFPFVPTGILPDFFFFSSTWEITLSLSVGEKKKKKPVKTYYFKDSFIISIKNVMIAVITLFNSIIYSQNPNNPLKYFSSPVSQAQAFILLGDRGNP